LSQPVCITNTIKENLNNPIDSNNGHLPKPD